MWAGSEGPEYAYTLVVFESEEKARAREHDPRLQQLMARMPEIYDGPPDFVDLEVLREG